MNKITKIAAASAIGLVFLATANVAFAQSATTSTSTLVTQIQAMLQQIKTLQDQIAALDSQRGTLVSQLQSTMQLTRQLTLGATGDDVKTLQQILATDPSIYPEGLTTGFFGALTEKAVKRFQAKFGLEQVGNVGPKTLSALNQLLTVGAGNSGKVPPGLLIAPGLANKISTSTPRIPLPGQVLPPGIAKKLGYSTYTYPTTTPDTVAPVISSIAATSTASTTGYISWITNEGAKSNVWYGTTSPVSTSGAANMTNASLSTSHAFNLTGLTATTTYYFVVNATDASGNTSTSSQNSFTTTQ